MFLDALFKVHSSPHRFFLPGVLGLLVRGGGGWAGDMVDKSQLRSPLEAINGTRM